ncbi:histidine kinase [Aggregicoccus sp. 17bor-14]|uniref:sensor histidine kinase n=1 Tax=Myxococcaceae TaxID=31 RepID=UPI00129CA134|nr:MULTISPECIES: ATP-binding protein [Myxococcaceae]MBF5046375.1 histidine kinase [Simulacricoccus sp. 17bor-14]MRI92095.1 histidine kinase [Aggregicoccus sp. 17bor-14]
MRLTSLLLVLLAPPLAAFALLALLDHGSAAALEAALVAFGGALAAYLATRGSAGRRLELLARQTRRRGEGAAPPTLQAPGLRELEEVQGAIESLEAKLAARNAALEREARIQSAVLDSMAEGVWVTDAQGTVVRHNDALPSLLATSPGPRREIVGQRPIALVRHEPLHAAVLAACRQGESTQLELALEGLYPRTLAIRVTPLGRELPGSAAVFHDVTELRRLEKVRKDFVANVSHELRTPITAIRGYAETLQGGALADSTVAPRMVGIIHRQAERLGELVEDLLELSRLEGRELRLQSTRVPLAPAAARAAETVRLKAEGKGLTVGLEVPADLSAHGDARAVEQVLINLLDNAVKYTPAGGSVQVSAEQAGGRLVLRVRDTGVGMEARHLGRIFERFYRVDPGRSRDMGGTGLGLSIVKHLVGAMGGEVRVESEPGRGSTFTVWLPASPPVAPPPG